MKKKLLTALLVIIFNSIFIVSAQNMPADNPPKKPTYQEFRKIDKILDERLHLTHEQKKYIKEVRPKHAKEFLEVARKMQTQKENIRNVYLSGIPSYQAYIKTAPYKAQLVILNQQILKMRDDNRKNFEKILTPEQRTELAKIREEFKPKNHN